MLFWGPVFTYYINSFFYFLRNTFIHAWLKWYAVFLFIFVLMWVIMLNKTRIKERLCIACLLWNLCELGEGGRCLFVRLFIFFFIFTLFPDGGGGDSGGDDSNKKKGANYHALYIAIPIVLLAALVTVLVLVYYRRSVHIRGGRLVRPLWGWEGVAG